MFLRRAAQRASLLFLLLSCGLLLGCKRPDPDPAAQPLAGADPPRGQRLLAHYQCGSCHVIPGVPDAVGQIGPSLERFGARSYIAGRLPNRAQTLARWIESPQALVPSTPMPDMGAAAGDAKDMAAYLSRLR